MKRYTEEELRARISKKYHDMIDWKSTMRFGFDGFIELVDNGQSMTSLSPSLIDRVSDINYYLREIRKDPSSEW